MVIHKNKHWFSLLFTWKGSILKKVLPQLFSITFFALIVLYFHGEIYDYKIHLNPAIFTLIGLALAIFMGFCNNAGYDRYWEGRKLWGTLLIEARSLARQILTLVREDSFQDTEEKKYFINVISAFCWALNYQLRFKDDCYDQIERLLSTQHFEKVVRKKFKPIAILDIMAIWVEQKHREQKIDSILWKEIDEEFNKLSQIVGGCERILNTPLPFPYRLLLHRTVYLYCFWLPFGLVDIVGVMMPIIVLLISYTFVGLDAIIQEISEPFGEEENDLALDALCMTIEESIREQFEMENEVFEKGNTYFIT